MLGRESLGWVSTPLKNSEFHSGHLSGICGGHVKLHAGS
jgi:hypothetical protein